MMYMPDLLSATIGLMEAPDEALTQRTYNIGAMSFTPEQLAASIRRVRPHFAMSCAPDFRQAIAETWPQALDDSAARRDWGWQPRYDLDAMTDDMLRVLSARRDAEAAGAAGRRALEWRIQSRAGGMRSEVCTLLLCVSTRSVHALGVPLDRASLAWVRSSITFGAVAAKKK